MPKSNQTDYLPVDVAVKRILDAVDPVRETELISSKESTNRILAEALNAQQDIPSADNSAMDGYLFLTKDLESGKRSFELEGEIRPENPPPSNVKSGTCLEIMTGAPVPEGDCTVVPVELTTKNDSYIKVNKVPERNPIRRQGEGYQKGKAVLPKGTVIRPYEIGLMIESGSLNCRVLKPIRLAVQVTGSEIDENKNSNGPVVNGLAGLWPGTKTKEWPVLDDDPELVKERMLRLKDSADIVLTTGGISMGKHDYILGVMEDLGADVIVRKIQQKPGKPMTVTKLDDTLFFHLPGNPISAVFTAEYYARKAVYKMLGMENGDRTVLASSPLENHRQEKTLFVPGKLNLDEKNRMTVSSKGVMKSHLMQLYHNSDVYIRLEPETDYAAGNPVRVTPYSTTRLP